MIRRGQWKLFDYHDAHGPALFDLAADPDELNDLGADPGHAAIRSQLLDRLHQDWDPEFVLRATQERTRDMGPIIEWGRTIEPRHEDVLAVPDVEDVVFV